MAMILPFDLELRVAWNRDNRARLEVQRCAKRSRSAKAPIRVTAIITKPRVIY
jgi:hypothetical protein